MIASLLAVLGFTTGYAIATPMIAPRTPPALATRVLVPASLLIALAGTFALGVAAFTLLGQYPKIAELGPWQPATLRADTPVPRAAAVVGTLLLCYALASALYLVSHRCRTLVGIHRACGRLGVPGSLIIVESDIPDAFTTPEATGRIIVTRGMLNALLEPERTALLAHETSHLRHRHTWWFLAADLAAAINPTLRPTARALHQTVERWADEDAATTVGSRRTVACALARAALAAHRHRTSRPSTTLIAATGGDVPARVAALLAPRSRRTAVSLAAITLPLLLLSGTAGACLAVQQAGETLFEQVMAGHTHSGQAIRNQTGPADRRIVNSRR